MLPDKSVTYLSGRTGRGQLPHAMHYLQCPHSPNASPWWPAPTNRNCYFFLLFFAAFLFDRVTLTPDSLLPSSVSSLRTRRSLRPNSEEVSSTDGKGVNIFARGLMPKSYS